MLENISVILVEPSGPMNIGMAARAMKNCGITRLKLVAPVAYRPDKAYMMACSAKDVVDNAGIFGTLKEALKGETCSVALSRRMTRTRAPYYRLEEILPRLSERAKRGGIALVFGREADGLTREELYECDYRVSIRTSKKFGSLNLAQAVLLACHSFFMAADVDKETVNDFFASNEETAPMFEDFAKLLIEIGYDHAGDVKLRQKIVQAFKETCGRAGLRRKDVNMFLGIWSQIRKSIAGNRN